MERRGRSESPPPPQTMTKASKTAAAPVAATHARALVDLPQHGVLAGELLVAAPDVIAQLAAAARCDTHPDAVAAAANPNT